MKKFVSLSVIMALMLGFSSCARKIAFPVSSIAPAAHAVAKIKQDKNNNYQIDLTANYLADPQRLDPPMNVYVVWMATDDNRIINMGQLVSQASRKASLSVVTSFIPVQLFITAEDDSNVKLPSRTEIFRTDRFNL